MKQIFYISILSIVLVACKPSTEVSSPNGSLSVRFEQSEDGGIGYSVSRDGETIIASSPLGFIAEEADLSRGFTLQGSKRSSHASSWETVWGEERVIEDKHNSLVVSLAHETGIWMDIEFRVFDDGFALRYRGNGRKVKGERRKGERRKVKGESQKLTITDELTAYRFTQGAEAWSIPWRTEYYEGLWSKRSLSPEPTNLSPALPTREGINLSPALPSREGINPTPALPTREGDGVCTDTLCSPITIEFADGTYGFVHEAALTDYPAQNLYVREGALRTYLTPWREEPPTKPTNPTPALPSREGEVKAYVSLPFETPWRFVILTKTLREMTASRIMLNLNEPCRIEDTSWIKPMKFIGIWWGMHIKTMTWEQGLKHGATTANMERYLRFAKEHGIQAVLAEGWNVGWEDWKHFDFTTPYSDWDMDYLSRLADSLGVQIVGHNETGGNAADYERDLDSIYRYHAKHGIHAIKTGYVAPIIRTKDGLQWNKGQSGVRHYRKVIETAAKYHIAIDNHEPVMPTGLQRTYPNLMTQEGVRGQEWNAWSADGGNPCEHVTVLPYTRIMAGSVDYTPGVFHFENPGNTINPNPDVAAGKKGKTPRVHATLMNQLGLFVCFYSPLQMACDLPEHYMEHADAFRFIEHVPCDWERSVLVDGKIGDYCVFARQGRGTEDWYIGGITDEEAREVAIPMSLLTNLSHDPSREGINLSPAPSPQERGGKALQQTTYQITLYRDAEGADWENNPYAYVIEEKELTAADTLRVWMAPGGGFAAEVR